MNHYGKVRPAMGRKRRRMVQRGNKNRTYGKVGAKSKKRR